MNTSLQPFQDQPFINLKTFRKKGTPVWFVESGGQLYVDRANGKTDPGWRGHGFGIIIQGAFLFSSIHSRHSGLKTDN